MVLVDCIVESFLNISEPDIIYILFLSLYIEQIGVTFTTAEGNMKLWFIKEMKMKSGKILGNVVCLKWKQILYNIFSDRNTNPAQSTGTILWISNSSHYVKFHLKTRIMKVIASWFATDKNTVTNIFWYYSSSMFK